MGVQIYSEFKDVGNKYKQRIRSRVSNFGDLKNPNFRQNVISGQLSPSKVASMTAQVSISSQTGFLGKCDTDGGETIAGGVVSQICGTLTVRRSTETDS